MTSENELLLQVTHKTNTRGIDFVTSVLKAEHKQEVIAMMTEAFCNAEPMTEFIHMPYEGFSQFATIITDKAIVDGLSAVVLNEHGHVIACTIVEDIADPAPLDLSKLETKFYYIFSLLESLSKDIFHDKVFLPNSIAHLFITAVHKDYRGLGLSRIVNLRSSNIAAMRGYDFMCCEFTNYINEQGTVKYLPFEYLKIGSVIYDTYIQDGIRPFEGLDHGANAYLWALHPHAHVNFTRNEQIYSLPLSADLLNSEK